MPKIIESTMSFLLLFFMVCTNHVFAQQQSLRELLTDINCPASCYLGIIPGITTQTEFEHILIQNHIKAVSSPIGPAGKLLIYSFAVNDPNGFIINGGDGVYIDVTANKVDQITLLLTNVTVQDIVSLYGAPDAVTGKSGNLIIYKSQGVVFSTSQEDPNQIEIAYLQEAVEGRSRLSSFLDIEQCANSSPNCFIPTATPTPVFSPTPTATFIETSTLTATSTATAMPHKS